MTGNIIAESPWEIARLGKFTSSRIDALFTEPKSVEAKKNGDLSDSAKTYIKEKAAEIITGTTRQIDNWSMEWGNTYEPHAADILKETYPDMIYLGKQSPQFFKYTDFSGGSPDGVDKVNRIVFEIKCPEAPVNHVDYCMLQSAEELKKSQRDYYHQIQMNMACVAEDWAIDFMTMKAIFTTYCPLVNDPYPKLRSLVIYPDQSFFDRLPGVIANAEKKLAEIIWSLADQPAVILNRDKQVNATVVENLKVPLIKL